MSDGGWVENDARWFEMRTVYCELCGRVIPKHFWRVAIDGAPRLFCNLACETLYLGYVLASGERNRSSSAPEREST